jgi:hypothetical protein
MVASAPKNICYNQSADPEVMFIEKIWNDPDNIKTSTVPVACWLRSAPINNCFDQSLGSRVLFINKSDKIQR